MSEQPPPSYSAVVESNKMKEIEENVRHILQTQNTLFGCNTFILSFISVWVLMFGWINIHYLRKLDGKCFEVMN